MARLRDAVDIGDLGADDGVQLTRFDALSEPFGYPASTSLGLPAPCAFGPHTQARLEALIGDPQLHADARQSWVGKGASGSSDRQNSGSLFHQAWVPIGRWPPFKE